MTTAIQTNDMTVGQLIAQRPHLAPLLEQLGIDYCCGGKRPLDEVCLEHGLDPATVRAMLGAMAQSPPPAGSAADADAMTPAELADHIERTHHAYLRQHLPRLRMLLDKVVSAHAESHPWLNELRTLFERFEHDIELHMRKEEQVLFPLIRRLDKQGGDAEARAVLACPIEAMEHEHDDAGRTLRAFRNLTSGYTPPADACETFRQLLAGLAELERDMHHHVHKENNVLFVKAVQHG